MPASLPETVTRTCRSDEEENAFFAQHQGYRLIDCCYTPGGERILRLERKGAAKPGNWAPMSEAYHGRFKSAWALRHWLLTDAGAGVGRRIGSGMVRVDQLDAALDREAASQTPAEMVFASAQRQRRASSSPGRKGKKRGARA